MVIKSKSEQDLIEDVEETLYKLQRVNMKLDPNECAFRMEEGNFLGYVMKDLHVFVDQGEGNWEPKKEGAKKYMEEVMDYSVLTDHLIRRIHQLDTTYQTFYPEQRIEFYSLNDVSVLPNNTTYSVNSIRRTGIQQTYTAYSN
ncbi:hypothetical protein Tco_1163689 [Tanacetum coccineum]